VVGDAGVLVPTADAGALAEAIEALLGDPERRIGLAARGRRRALAQFSWPVAAERLSSYYHAMLERTGR